MPELTVAMFCEAVESVCRLVDNVTDDHWDAPTPCPDWNVRQLADHLLAVQQAFVEIMAGQPATEPVVDFRTSATALADAFGQSGALERIVEIAVGSVPGLVAMHVQTVEHLVHGWDLATATGQTPRFAEAVVEGTIEFSHGLLTQIPAGPGGPFGPSQPAPESGPAIDRLAALLGRKIG